MMSIYKVITSYKNVCVSKIFMFMNIKNVYSNMYFLIVQQYLNYTSCDVYTYSANLSKGVHY